MAKYEDLVDIVRGEIRAGSFNNRFPSNRELAKRFGVAYVTANKVVNALVDEGLLYREHGRGTFLAENQTTAQTDLDTHVDAGFIGLIHRQNLVSGPETFLGQVLSGIHQVLDRQGSALQVFPLEQDRLQDWHQDLRRLSGLLLMDHNPDDADIKWIKDNNVPTVIFGQDRSDAGISSVDIDNVNGAYQALTQLLNNGFRKPAIVEMAEDSWFKQERRGGFQQALDGFNLGPAKTFTLADYGHEPAKETWNQIAEYIDEIDCIICPSPMMAVETIHQLKAKGLQPGKDVGVILYGNLNDTAIPPTPFPTCLSMPFTRMAEMAATMLNIEMKAHFENRTSPTQRRLIPPMLRIGHTCGAIRWWEQ